MQAASAGRTRRACTPQKSVYFPEERHSWSEGAGGAHGRRSAARQSARQSRPSPSHRSPCSPPRPCTAARPAAAPAARRSARGLGARRHHRTALGLGPGPMPRHGGRRAGHGARRHPPHGSWLGAGLEATGGPPELGREGLGSAGPIHRESLAAGNVAVRGARCAICWLRRHRSAEFCLQEGLAPAGVRSAPLTRWPSTRCRCRARGCAPARYRVRAPWQPVYSSSCQQATRQEEQHLSNAAVLARWC